ncbi:hypothetical protein D3C86_2164610 [compost metagenome]
MKVYKEAFRTLIILYTAQKLAPHKLRKAISGGGHKTHERISAQIQNICLVHCEDEVPKIKDRAYA